MMTNEEIERLVTRTAEQLAETQTILRGIVANQADHDERITRFERSYSAIADLLQRHDVQLDEVTAAGNTTNGVVQQLATITVRHDQEINHLTEAVRELTTTVNRYIVARGNGSNGAGGNGGQG